MDNPSPHPVIMLRHTYAEDLESILEFIYQGEAQVRARADTPSSTIIVLHDKHML